MRKEVVLAIFFGTAFGLVIAFGVWRLNASITTKNTPPSGEASGTKSDTTGSGLTIAKPESYSVFGEPIAKITGITKAGSWVIASGEEKDAIVQASSDGAFEVSVELIAGLNSILVVSFDESGKENTKTIYLVHSTQFATEDDNESTASADIKEDVQKKIAEAENPPVAYIGTITDILENTIHVKNTGDEIKQVSVASDTTYGNSITNKSVGFNDLAIGDFVLALGHINGNQVLKGKRIVVSNKVQEIGRAVYFGKVTSIESKELIFTKSSGEEIELIFPKTWKGPNIKDTDEGVGAIVVTNDVKTEVRTIQLIAPES